MGRTAKKAADETKSVDKSSKPSRNEIADRLQRKIYTSLSRAEVTSYFLFWVGAILYSSYNVYEHGARRRDIMVKSRIVIPYNPRWYPLSSPQLYRDGSDQEWMVWNYLLNTNLLPLALAYPFLSQLVKNYLSRWAFLFTAVYSVLYTILLIGLPPVLLIFIQMLVIFSSYFVSNHAGVVWMVTMTWSQLKDKVLDDTIRRHVFAGSDRWSEYITHIMAAWVSCRCVSFCLDRIWKNVEREKSVFTALVNLTAFCFYLPLGIMGPLITSKQFKEAIEKSSSFNKQYVFFTVTQAFRFLFWYLTIEIFLCIFYQNAISNYPAEVESLNMWAVCGLGYLMGQYFQLKYVMMYGTASYLARLDDVDAPREPICIARVHLYSDMWRHFDAGLHRFMHTYIYQPLVAHTSSKLGRISISIIIFAFIYVWHGTYDFVLIWSVLNCVGVLAEGVARDIGKMEAYAKWELGVFGERGQRRFHAALGGPLFLMSCLSNFYFFAGKEVGNIMVYRTFHDTWPFGFPFLIFVFYSASQFSIEVKNWELRKQLKKLD